MKKLHFIIYVLFLIVIGILGLSYFQQTGVYQNLETKIIDTQTKLNESEIKAQKMEDEYNKLLSELDITKWQVYRNEEFGFEMMVPGDWIWEDVYESDEEFAKRKEEFVNPNLKRIEGIYFYKILEDATKEQVFHMRIFKNSKKWGAEKAWALTSDQYDNIDGEKITEKDYDGEKFIGKDHYDGEKFIGNGDPAYKLHQECKTCILSYFWYTYDMLYGEDAVYVFLGDYSIYMYDIDTFSNYSIIIQTIHK
jgi:hypothetical protein